MKTLHTDDHTKSADSHKLDAAVWPKKNHAMFGSGLQPPQGGLTLVIHSMHCQRMGDVTE